VLYLFTLLVFPLRLVGWALAMLPASLAGWARIREVLDESVERDPREGIREPAPGTAVVCEEVGFSYDDTPVLTNVSLSIPSGSTVAIVGPTGSGKSTLLQVVAGLLEPGAGTVAVQGASAALVFQEAFLVAGTIADNVTLGDPFPAEHVDDALRRAAADDFVGALPLGAATVVGERGVSLSGGQRQRVALARALIRRPAVLLLDDTTSALDPTTESRILEMLARSGGATTTLVVASRPSTIALADEVIFLVGGAVRAHGTHATLMRDDPDYRALVEAYEHDRRGGDDGATGHGAVGVVRP
jgi:ABC-type multidrug transport system fused ATPase/permease subunit